VCIQVIPSKGTWRVEWILRNLLRTKTPSLMTVTWKALCTILLKLLWDKIETTKTRLFYFLLDFF
jgi:hypothetical protein